MALFALADRLHCPVYRLSDMPVAELVEWAAYFKIERDRKK